MTIAYLYFSFSALFNALVSTFLGLFIYFKGKNEINKSFALFCFGVAAWSYPYIFWPLATTKEGALLAFQLLHISACFISIFYLNFVLRWLGLYEKRKYTVYFGYLLSLFFVCFIPTTLFIKDMVPKFSMRFWAEPGILYHFYLVMFFSYFLYSSYLLLKSCYQETSIKRQQIKLILVGMVLGFFGGSTNYFLWYNINLPPYGNILVASFVIFTAISILKYNLFRIKVIATESFVASLWVFLLVRTLLSSTVIDAIINFILFVSTLVIGIFLVRSVEKEVSQREHIEKLAGDLALANNQLKFANEKLKGLDKQKTEFVSMASHQLRSPLTAIKGYTSMLLEGSFGPIGEKACEAIDRVFQSSQKLVDIIEDFLNITRIELGRMKYEISDFDLDKLVEQVIGEQKPNIEKRGLVISSETDGQNHIISADTGKVSQVISNILDNATKYTEKGWIKVKVETIKNNIRLTVQDSGVGIDPTTRLNLFEKFIRADDAGKTNIIGTGLGLYVAKQIMEGLGGKIWAESEGKGKGSTFIVEFPKAKSNASPT